MHLLSIFLAFVTLAIAQHPANRHGPFNNPLGFAIETHSATAYGKRPPAFPTNLPRPSIIPTNGTLSTSDDAKSNPWRINSPQHRGNWLPGFTINTRYEEQWPTTGRTVRAAWTVTNTTFAPDGGDPQIMMLVNGQYPGPLLEGNWGDYFEVTVINKLQNNGTGIHWHGFRQLNNNDADGPGGVTECPIPPGGRKTYRFQATGYGSTWYHSHFSTQYGAGVVGPVVVHGPASANYDIDLGSVLLNEWYDQTIFQKAWIADRFGPPQAANYLVNGRNIKPDGSSGQRTQFKFTPGRKHLLRFVNTAVDQLFKVQIDGHSLLVIANDNVPIVPYSTKELSIAIGQRYDVVVTADQAVSNYYLRTIPAPACSFNRNDGLGVANAIISYNGATSALPNTTATLLNPQCLDEPLSSLVPIVTQPVDSSTFAAQFATLPVNLRQATLTSGDNVFLWYLNGHSSDIDWSNPTISAVSLNNSIANAANTSTYLPNDWNTISLPKPNVWTFWVIQNQFFVPHPMHLHGHDFALLGQGSGTFDSAVHLSSLNFKNPTRRDVAMLVASGWTVIAFKTDNPGAWLMHCHIAWHVGEGLSVQFVELPSQMPRLYGQRVGKGSEFQRNCRAWDDYVAGAVYGKSDSGLRRREEEGVVERGRSGVGSAARLLNRLRPRRSIRRALL
jgi:FtsP/CotA-like multicopper oxidase with cupredoxin domain